MTRRRTVSVALERWEAANPPAEPQPWMPHYVHACFEQRWTIQYRHKLGLMKGMALPFCCNSRHHRGPCRGWWCSSLRGRLTDPASKLQMCEPDEAMFWTLTFDRFVRGPANSDPATKEERAREANRLLGKMWRRFYGMLMKRAARAGLPGLAYFWIREAHRDGFPHLHLIVVNRELADCLRERDAELSEHPEVRGDDRTLAPMWLREMAQKCGFGMRFDAQVARDRGALAGYASKATAAISDAEIEATNERIAGEVAKGQGDLKPPRHCRVYGCSKGFVGSGNSAPAVPETLATLV